MTGPNCGRSDDNVQAYHDASRYEARSSEIKPADGTFGAQETLLPLLEISRRRKRGQSSIAMTSRHAPRISLLGPCFDLLSLCIAEKGLLKSTVLWEGCPYICRRSQPSEQENNRIEVMVEPAEEQIQGRGTFQRTCGVNMTSSAPVEPEGKNSRRGIQETGRGMNRKRY